MKFRKLPLVAAIVVAMGSSSAAYAVSELEPNNTFADRDLLAAGVWDYQGELSLGTPVDSGGPGAGPIDPFYSTIGTLTEGAVDYFTVGGLNEGDDIQIFLSNAPNGPTNNPDTVLGVFDGAGALIASDSSYSSEQSLWGDTFVSPAGDLSIGVTGWPDYDFDGKISPAIGSHTQSGDYELNVFVNAPEVDPWGNVIDDGPNGDWWGGELDGEFGQLIEGDVDFVQFTGLTPGEMFRVELSPVVPDTVPLPGEQSFLFDTGGMIGLFDDSGTLVAADKKWDDGLTVLGGIVPSSGTVNVAITGAMDDGGWGDDGEAFNGTSAGQDTGAYDLTLETFNLADPGADLGGIVVMPDDPGAGNPCSAATDCFGFGGLVVEDGEIVNLDPYFAIGYEFDIVGSGLFESVLLPAVGADTEFRVLAGSCDFVATAGTLYDFVTECGNNVNMFTVEGIDVNEELDPTDPIAFVTQVTFSGPGTYDVTMTPQTVWVPDNNNAVPEPATLALFSVGLAGFGFAGRRRKRG